MFALLMFCLFATFQHPVLVAGCTVAGCGGAFWQERRGRSTTSVSVARYAAGFFGGYLAGVALAIMYSQAIHERMTWLQ